MQARASHVERPTLPPGMPCDIEMRGTLSDDSAKRATNTGRTSVYGVRGMKFTARGLAPIRRIAATAVTVSNTPAQQSRLTIQQVGRHDVTLVRVRRIATLPLAA
jgi:hypothetical protein